MLFIRTTSPERDFLLEELQFLRNQGALTKQLKWQNAMAKGLDTGYGTESLTKAHSPVWLDFF